MFDASRSLAFRCPVRRAREAMARLCRRHGPWCNVDAVEYAALKWVDGFNNRRLPEPSGFIPPVGLAWHITVTTPVQTWRPDFTTQVSGFPGRFKPLLRHWRHTK